MEEELKLRAVELLKQKSYKLINKNFDGTLIKNKRTIQRIEKRKAEKEKLLEYRKNMKNKKEKNKQNKREKVFVNVKVKNKRRKTE